MIWQLGLLVFLGYGIDPLGILVPFLIFAIGVSHGVQKISAVKDAALAGEDSMKAAQRTFRQLLLPAIVALLADLVGFITILLIPVQVIQEMAITASLGVGDRDPHRPDAAAGARVLRQLRCRYRERIERRNAHVPALLGLAVGHCETRSRGRDHRHRRGACRARLVERSQVAIGDTQAGVPELRPDSRYNRDSDIITRKFSIGVDILNVIVETQPDGCIDYDVITAIDRFTWHMANVRWRAGRDLASGRDEDRELRVERGQPQVAQHPAQRAEQLVQAQAYIETSTGLFNTDCSVMPVMMFTSRSQGQDHRARRRRGQEVAQSRIPRRRRPSSSPPAMSA